MADLIYRQAAINALENTECELLPEEWDDLTDAIMKVPSAQPDIVRCKDCKYQRKGQNECEAWNLCGYRPWQYTPITDEHFCSYAERRTE